MRDCREGCMCDDCKLAGLEAAACAREEEDRKAIPGEVDRSQLPKLSAEEVAKMKDKMAQIARWKPCAP